MRAYYVRVIKSHNSEESILFFIRAETRAEAKFKTLITPEAQEYILNNPDHQITVFSAGVQSPARAEGLVPDFLIGMSNGK